MPKQNLLLEGDFLSLFNSMFESLIEHRCSTIMLNRFKY
jgi:hypothetical protein